MFAARLLLNANVFALARHRILLSVIAMVFVASRSTGLNTVESPVVVSWPQILDGITHNDDWAPECKAMLWDVALRAPDAIQQYKNMFRQGDRLIRQAALDYLSKARWGLYDIAEEVLRSNDLDLMRHYAFLVDLDVNLAKAASRSSWAAMTQQEIKPRLEALLTLKTQSESRSILRTRIEDAIASRSSRREPEFRADELLVDLVALGAIEDSEIFVPLIIEWIKVAPTSTETDRSILDGAVFTLGEHIGPLAMCDTTNRLGADQCRDHIIGWWSEAKDRRPFEWLLSRLSDSGIVVSNPSNVAETVSALVAGLRSSDVRVAHAAARAITLLTDEQCAVTMPRRIPTSDARLPHQFGGQDMMELLSAIASAKTLAYFANGNKVWDESNGRYVDATGLRHDE